MCLCTFNGLVAFLFLTANLQNVSCGTKNATNLKPRRVRATDDSGLTCELPQHPKNGRWTIVNGSGRPGDFISKDTILKFECDPGYKLASPSPFLPCDAKWRLTSIPICEKKCKAIYSTATTILKCEDKHGREVKCDEAVDGTYLSSSCIPFYETPLGYKKSILCLDGLWNFPNPVCQPVCGKKIDTETVTEVYRGKKKDRREYPWIIAVFQKIDDKFRNVCGGSLISQRVIITAAHCVSNDFGDTLPIEDFMVAAGKYYTKYRDSRDNDVQYAEVSRLVAHNRYKGPHQRFLADIALIITKDLITFTNAVQPVCYQDLPSIYLQAGKIGVVAGWGISETGEQPDSLRTLEIPYKYETTCARELPPDWANKFNTIDKICAGFFNQNKSVCNGDSGSGLYFINPEDNRYYVHGIVSLGLGKGGECNPQQNSLYTNVAHYYEFIDRETTRQYVEHCTLPLYPPNGKWTITNQDRRPGEVVASNTVLKIECNQGYGLSSKVAFIDCQSAYAMPKCELLCPDLSFPAGTTYNCSREGSEIDCSKPVQGTTLNYSCPLGYKQQDNMKYCNGGTWGQRKPECTAEVEVSIIPGHSSGIVKNKKVVCTYASWWAILNVPPEDLNVTLCTDIIYSFIGVREKGDLKVQNGAEFVELDKKNGIFKKFTDLKQKNEKLKVLLSIGRTDGEDASIFADIASNENKITAFVYSALYYIEAYNFDGINIEWFYPQPKDKTNYVNLLKALREKCNEKNLLLTATVRVYPEETGYDGKRMAELLDWVNIRTYDFYGPWSTHTGQNSALYPNSLESDWEKNHLNINASVHSWMKFGLPKDKIVPSIAFYGRSFTLKDKEDHSPHKPFIKEGFEIVHRYSESCKNKKWTSIFDDEQKSVISYYEDQWMGLENNDSVRIKAAYAKDNGFLGVNVWPVDGDDIYGVCGPKNILLQSVHEGLNH